MQDTFSVFISCKRANAQKNPFEIDTRAKGERRMESSQREETLNKESTLEQRQKTA